MNQLFVYKITGMHCNACVGRVSKALAGLADEISVTLTPGQATLNAATQPSIDAVREAISSAGKYSVEYVASPEAPSSFLSVYRPVLLILAYVTVLACVRNLGPFDFKGWMNDFMAGFFIVFSFFKLLDVKAFANAYAGYDLLAKRWRGWGTIYPFIELALGAMLAFRLAPTTTHYAVLVLMAFSAFGVISALRDKRQIRCACLGGVFNLPMSTVTLIEDGLMVAMALLMLLG
jgi:copper chaperone CopZ